MKHRSKKLKIEHGIIKGLRDLLAEMAKSDLVESVIPGEIKSVSKARGAVRLRFKYKTVSGGKYLAYGASAVQEVFIVSPDIDALNKAFGIDSEVA